MEIIKAGIKNEVAKLLKLKKYRILLLIITILSILSGLLGTIIKGLIGIHFYNIPFVVLSIAAGFLLPLMIPMEAADLFTAEQENGSIKAVITRPISRINIFISKILAIISYTILILLVCLMGSLISNIVFNGIGSLNSIIEILLAYTVSIIPMITIILFAVLISQLCKNSSSTVILFAFVYIIIFVISSIFPIINPMVFTSYTSWYKLFIGATMPIGNILNVLVLLMAYTLIFFGVSSWIFEKNEY